MKKVIYYITDHGRGHATRSVAIIRELQKQKIDVIIRNSNVIDFLNKSLPQTKVINGITDVGQSMKKDGLSVNKIKSLDIIEKWIRNIESFADGESIFLSKVKPDLVISDISPMPLLAAKKLNIRSIAISNFSWYDVLNYLPPSKLKILKKYYNNADFTIRLPLGTKMSHFRRRRKVGIVARTPTSNRQITRRKLGIKESELMILFYLGRFAENIKIKVGNDIKIVAAETKLRNRKIINVSQWCEGQDLVAASDLVICKCGYSIISECLTNGVPFFYFMDKNHLEQVAISKELIKMGINNVITLKTLKNTNFNSDFISSLKVMPARKNETANVAKLILKSIN